MPILRRPPCACRARGEGDKGCGIPARLPLHGLILHFQAEGLLARLLAQLGRGREGEDGTYKWNVSLYLGAQLLLFDLVVNFRFLSLWCGPIMVTSTKGRNMPEVCHFRSLAATTAGGEKEAGGEGRLNRPTHPGQAREGKGGLDSPYATSSNPRGCPRQKPSPSCPAQGNTLIEASSLAAGCPPTDASSPHHCPDQGKALSAIWEARGPVYGSATLETAQPVPKGSWPLHLQRSPTAQPLGKFPSHAHKRLLRKGVPALVSDSPASLWGRLWGGGESKAGSLFCSKTHSVPAWMANSPAQRLR